MPIDLGRTHPYRTAGLYALAAGSVGLVVGVRLLLDPLLRDHHPFVLFVAPVLLAAWTGGWRLGVLTLGVCLLAADYLFIHPRGSVGQYEPETAVVVAVFCLVGGVTIGLVEAVRAARRRSASQTALLHEEIAGHRETQAALRAVQKELERRVDRRTTELIEATGHLRDQETARRDAEARVRRLAALVASSEEAIIGLDPAGTVTDWNVGAEHLFGFPPGEVVGRHVGVLVPADDRGAVERTLDRLRQGQDVPPYEAVRLRRDGTGVPVSVRVSPIREDDRTWGVSLIYHDLTHVKRLEEQFRQAQKMEAVGQLAGGVAHDFNNLLTVINGYADLLLTQLPPGDPARGPVEEIHGAGGRAAALTRQLLAFSRKQVTEPRVLDLNEVVRRSESMLRRLIGEDVRLTTALAPNLGRVKADPGQVEQLVLNLAVNARDAMPRGGRLTIETADVELDEGYAGAHPEVWAGRYVLLAVSDTGVGMTDEVKARVFEPFFTTKGVGQGTGLGLAVVHGVVKQSGGAVTVYSEPGRGTTFKVYLPVVEGVREAGPSHPGVKELPGGSEVVLLVEDEESVRRFTKIALEAAGYTVLEAAHGGEAVRLAERHDGPIHLLVSDVVMPEMGGRVLAERLSASRPGVRVLFLSGYTDDAVVRHGILEEAEAFLQKPFTPGALARKVRDVLDG